MGGLCHQPLRQSGSRNRTAPRDTMLYIRRQSQVVFPKDAGYILLRFCKPVPKRLRPKDRMVAHTDFPVFARAIQAGAAGEGEAQER
jgi:tRNA A58 N-methylase Trm61